MTARSSGRVDALQPEIILNCRQVGMEVFIMSQYSGHPFDLLIGYRGKLLAFEVKSKPNAKLTDNERVTFDRFQKVGVTIYQVVGFDEIMDKFN